MAYPNSSDVAPGQPTASAHYNNLRKDALYFGNAAADSLNAGAFLARTVQNLTIIYLATNRLRVPYSTTKPATLMINGYALKATADIDLAAGMFSGAAATWYIFAVRNAGSTTFTLSVNTSPVEAADQQLIGYCYWDGANVGAVQCYYSTTLLPIADYDSGWFACAYNNTYTKAHGLGTNPRLVVLVHATDSVGTSEWVHVSVLYHTTAGVQNMLSYDASSVIAQASNSSTKGTCLSSRRESGGGYWRILAWK